MNLNFFHIRVCHSFYSSIYSEVSKLSEMCRIQSCGFDCAKFNLFLLPGAAEKYWAGQGNKP